MASTMPISTRVHRHLSQGDTMETVCKHIAAGGTLIQYCREFEIPYAEAAFWIQKDPERAKEYRSALVNRKEWVIEGIIGQLTDMSDANLADMTDEDGKVLPPNRWPPAVQKIVSQYNFSETEKSTNISIKISDRLKALELLGKNLGIFREQIEHTGTVTLSDMVAQASAVIEGEFNEVHAARKAEIQSLDSGEKRNDSGAPDGVRSGDREETQAEQKES